MKNTVFLIATKHGIQRMTKRAPSLFRGEVAVALTITIPPEVFRPATIPASVEIAEGQVTHPTIEIETHVQDEDPPQATTPPDGEAGEGQEPPPGEVGPDGLSA